MGCLLATLPPARVAIRYAWAGVVVLALSFTVVSFVGVGHSGPALAAECATAAGGAAALIRGITAPSVLVGMLSFRPVTWLGERTYGMYLFHVPFVILLATLPPVPRAAGVLAGTVATAAASFTWIEQPIRRWSRKVTSVSAAVTPGEIVDHDSTRSTPGRPVRSRTAV